MKFAQSVRFVYGVPSLTTNKPSGNSYILDISRNRQGNDLRNHPKSQALQSPFSY